MISFLYRTHRVRLTCAVCFASAAAFLVAPAELRAQIHNHAAAMSDPTVQASRERLRQTAREFHESMRAAMLKADPSVQPILEKLPKKHGGQHP